MERAELERIVFETGVAERCGGFVFLRDPQWTPAQRAGFAGLIPSEIENRESKIKQGWLCIPTGGTGGLLKFARHDEHTVGAAVRGFCQHFGLARVNAVGVLPPHHVSGFMARVRCHVTGGRHVAWDWKALEAGKRPGVRGEGAWVISLVPTQLQRLLQSRAAVTWLRRFELVLLGGGPVWPELAAAAARARLRIALSYGMTETAAMITALRPEEFLSGARSSGQVLPHARLRLGRGGAVRVGGLSLFRGYYGGRPVRGEWATEDLAEFDAAGRLHLRGRRDDVIITGGKKVRPALVEAALRATGAFTDVAVIGLPHPEWGEMVVACHPVEAGRKRELPPPVGLPSYQRPKRFIAIPDWPRNAQGKINRVVLKAAASALIDPGGESRR